MENKKIKKPSPMMQHYLTVKEKYPDAILIKLERGKRWTDITNINEVL